MIEPPLTLFEEEIEVSFEDSVVFSQVPLGLVPEILDAIDVVVLVGKQIGMIDPEMVEVGDVEHVIAAVAIGVDNAVGLDFARNYGISVSDLVSLTAILNTLPPRFSSPNTGVLPVTPRPRLPLRTPPK
jgi:hypothetical protein